MGERSAVRAGFLVGAGLLVLLVIWFGRACFGGWWILDRTPAADTYMLGTLYERWAVQIRDGRLPLWFPEFGGGYPVHAAWMYGLFYPPLILFCALPAAAAWTWLAILHALFGALGVFAFVQDRRRDVVAAACAAIVFATSGFVLGRAASGHLNVLMPFAWAPWTLLLAARTARGVPGAAAWLGVCAGAGLLAGHVQVWFYVAPLVAAYAVFEAKAHGTLRASAARFAAAAAIALGVSAIQWIPAAELFVVSGHPSEDPQHVTFCSATASALAAQIAPRFGDASEPFRHEYLGLSGPLAVGAALLAFRLRDSRRWFWIVAAALALFLAMGTRTEASRLANEIPPFAFGRAPGRALMVFVLAGAVLAGELVADWLGDAPRWARAAAPAAFLASALVFGAPPPRVVRADFLDYDWTTQLPPETQGRRVHVLGERYPFVERTGVRTVRDLCHLDTPGRHALVNPPSPEIAWWMDVGVEIGVPIPDGPPADAAALAGARERMVVRTTPCCGGATYFGAARPTASEADVLARLRAGERALWIDGPASAAEAPPGPPPAVVPRARLSPTEMAFDVVPHADRGWVLVSETWYPGWMSYDEALGWRPVRRGNLAFLAVPVASAARIAYRPWWPAPALAAAALALACAAWSLVRAARRRRSQAPPPARG